MAKLSLRNISHSFGGPILLDDVALQLEAGERLAVVGRNGCGKSTLLKILAGVVEPDSGTRVVESGIRVAYLPQDVPSTLDGTVGHQLRAAARDAGGMADWEIEETVGRRLADLGLEEQESASTLSAGKKRRLLLAAALIASPDVLLLDEPTNHLDIASIKSLEELLGRFAGCVLFITHDRRFLQRVADGIIDLDRGRLSRYACDYQEYLKRKEALLAAEAEQRAQFDKKLAQEEAWIRRGVQGRRARNMGRVRALQQMRQDRRERREGVGRVQAGLQESRTSGRIVLKASEISKSFDDRHVVPPFSTTVLRGDRIGVVGPNGAGKTTLLRMLLGELKPDAGEVGHGTNLDVAHFDQLHAGLDPALTVLENVGEGSDKITVGGQPRHVIGYLGDFLFTPEQVRGPVTKLSGGERNRLQLARILARPCNLLVLDEPTNDLDVETLELLEDLLFEYQGTMIIVSHDREFLNNVVTSTIAFLEDGEVREFAGGYDDMIRQIEQSRAGETVPAEPGKKAGSRKKRERPRRLSFNEKRELEALPERIEVLERDKAQIEETMSDPEFYRRDHEEVARLTNTLETLTRELDQLVERWSELEEIAERS